MSSKCVAHLYAIIIIILLAFLFILMNLTPKAKITFIPIQSKNIKHVLNRTNQSSLHLLSEHNPLDIAIINRNRTFPVNYSDPKFLGDCHLKSTREERFSLLKLWSEFAGQHNIMWFLQYGTLLGAIRHQDIVPWDQDGDIAIYQIDEPLIRKLATPRPIKTNYSIPNLVVRPGPHCPYNGPRQDCQGKKVWSQRDGCAFCGPLARYFFRPSVRIDVYVVNIEPNAKGQLAMSDEGMMEYSAQKTFYPLEDYLPLTVCNFINLTVLCPKNSIQLLNRIYTDYKAKYRCENATWVKIK